MKIINATTNQYLASRSHTLCVGFITGPIRAIGGIVQVCLNGVGMLFAAIPSTCGCLDRYHPLHVRNLARDCGVGFLHVVRGFIEFLPGSSFCIDTELPNGRPLKLTTDHPFLRIPSDDLYFDVSGTTLYLAAHHQA